ncbi:MAG: Rpn family recombination-promoting nuclease/putative transposase [Lachnospiraceae bacterium]|nr:Rpn family recombination-promoting nuclease/putative transposase [Lachnospiraceae bacterium]
MSRQKKLKQVTKHQKESKQIWNSKVHDSSSKLIFGNAELCSQFLRNYMDMPILHNIRAEDIEDVSERYIPMFTEERNADTVKRIKISEKDTFYFISLIEHKTKVDYNVSMQLLRYMVYIWEDYEREMERKHKGISRTRGFRYPPILPIVYYEGKENWSASGNFKDRILLNKAFEPFTPGFFYKLIQLNSYSIEELFEKNDELSLVMLLNRIQNMEEFRELDIPQEYLKNISEQGTDESLDIIGKVIAAILRHLQVPEEEIADFTGQVKERKMGELFENFKGYNLPEVRKEAREKGRKEGRKEGEELLLIRMVCKMLRKGKAIAEILEDWEEESPIIEEIYRIAQAFAPNYDEEEVRKAMKHSAGN